MAEIDLYRQEATRARVRAEIAEARRHTLDLRLRFFEDARAGDGAEIERLRKLVEVQRAEIERLRERLREVEAARRQIPIESLIEAILAAVDAGAQTLPSHAITTVRADLRVPLQVESGVAGMAVAAPGIYPGQALSTLSVDLRPLPLTPYEEARRRAIGAVLAAVLDLQRGLDRPFPSEARSPAETALVQASVFLDSPAVTPDTLGQRIGGLVQSLTALAAALPALAPAAQALAERRDRLPASPAEEDLEEMAGALAAVETALGGAGR